MLIWNKKKQQEKKEAELLYTLATKPASVNTNLLVGEVKETVKQYVYAIYTQNEDILPMRHMTEELYLAMRNRIREDINSEIIRCVEFIEVTSIKPIDYDNRIFYAVQSITYEVAIQIKGWSKYQNLKEEFCTEILCACVFINESRLGWILYQCKL